MTTTLLIITLWIPQTTDITQTDQRQIELERIVQLNMALSGAKIIFRVTFIEYRHGIYSADSTGCVGTIAGPLQLSLADASKITAKIDKILGVKPTWQLAVSLS